MFSVIYKINDKIGLTASPGFACSPERALSTTGGLWNHVLNIGVMLVTERLYALAGKGVALPLLTPLRTVRERLHSYGSSLIKAPFDRSRWHNKSYATFTIHTCSLLAHCRRMHTLWLKRSFAFPPLRKILQIFS